MFDERPVKVGSIVGEQWLQSAIEPQVYYRTSPAYPVSKAEQE